MASSSVSTKSGRGFRILSLDGGGVRGLSTLLILKRIMHSIRPCDNPYDLPKACDYFDLICGTSTGGLIAIMLGRLCMGIEQCIKAYREFAEEVFQEKFLSSTWKVGTVFGKSRFDERRLEQAFKKIVKEYSESRDEEAPMRGEGPSGCKVFVCATRSANAESSLLRSYSTSYEEGVDCTIWQAARATSAAPLFFSSTKFGNPPAEYVDGGLLNNNPVRVAAQEAYRLSDRKIGIACLLSVGTGIPKTEGVGSSGLDVLKTCVNIAFHAERTARSFKEDYYDSLVRDRRYFRFNVGQGLEGVKFEEWKYLDKIDAATRRYLYGVSDEIKACAKAISEPEQDEVSSDHEVQSSWPVYCELARAPSPYFTGRDDILSKLLAFYDPSSRDAARVAVLAGLGGIGKTQVALKYIQIHQPSYIGVFFVDASSEQELRTAFTRIAYDVIEEEIRKDPSKDYDHVAKVLGFAGLVGSRQPLVDDRKRLVNAVKKWLNHLTQPFLLVLDGADNPAESNLSDYIPSNVLGDVIITTSDSDASYLGELFSVEKLPEDASVALLNAASRGVLDTDRTQDEARRIVQELEGLPLAIDLAGGYFASSKTDIDAFLPTYEEHAKVMLSKVPANGLLGYRKSAFTTWEMSYAKAIQYEQSSGPVLKLLSFVYPRDICDLLYFPSEDHRGVSEKAPPERQALAKEVEEGFSPTTREWASQKSSFDIREALSALVKVCLIMRMPDDTTYVIHSTVHLWAREQLGPAEQRQYAQDAVILVARAIPSMKYLDNAESWMVHRRLQPHVNACWMNVKKYLSDGTDDNRSFLLALRMLATSYMSQGYLKTAEEMFSRVLEGQKQVLEANHPDTLTTMDNLASIYRELDNLDGNLKKAEELYNEVLVGRKKRLGARHPDTLTTVDHLASVYEYQGKFEKAEEKYCQALYGRKSQDYESSDVFGVFQELASLYNYHGKLDAAQTLHETALAGREKTLGPDDPDTLTTALSFGGLCWAKGDMDVAEDLYERAYEGRQQFFGSRHPQTLSALNGLAGLYGNLGRIQEAEQMYREVLDVRKEILGPDHPDTLWTHEGLSGLLINRGQLAEAEPLMKQAADGIKEALGADHIDTLWVHHSLALLYQHLDDPDRLKEAEEMHQRALEGHQDILGQKHPITLRILNDLGACYERAGKLEKAEEAMREAHDGMVEKLEDFNRPDCLYTGLCLAGARWSLGEEEEAEKLYKKVLEGMREVYRTDHPDSWCCLADLGGFYASGRDLTKAKLLLEECYKRREHALGEDHPETRQVREKLESLSNGHKPSQDTWPRRAKTLPSLYSFGRRRGRDERRWISE